MSDLLFEIGKDGNVCKALTLRAGDKGRRGASGSVFELSSDPGKAIKDYHDKERLKFEPKVRAMIKVKYNRPHVDRFDLAWPETIVVDVSGQFRGFKMPFFGSSWVDLEKLMQAKDAARDYGLGELHRLMIGANLAMAVKALHDLKIHCIDLKPENVRVNLKNMSVAIIDCDGMSVVDIGMPNSQRFYGDKFTPEFTPSENMDLRPHKFRDEEAHDRFSLATIIFMLLNRGLHPYSGIMPFDDPATGTVAGKIKNNLFPYGAGKGRIAPHEHSLYPFLPDDTKGLFDRAFSAPTSRPSADEWHSQLNQMALQCKSCEKNPEYHIKYPGAGCPICEFNQSAAATSPWAELVGSSVRPTPSPISVAPPPPPAPPRPPLSTTVASAVTGGLHSPAARASLGGVFSSPGIKLLAAFAVVGILYFMVGAGWQNSPEATRLDERVRRESLPVSPPPPSPPIEKPKPAPIPPSVTPPRPSTETVMRSAGLIGVWATDCNRSPSENNQHHGYSVMQGEGRASVDTGIARGEFIIRSAQGVGNNKVEFNMEQLPQRTAQHVVLLMDGSRLRTWTNRLENGQVVVGDGVSARTGQQTVWRVRCGSPAAAPRPAGQRCSAGGVIWNCDPGQRCGTMPSTCQQVQSPIYGRPVEIGRPAPTGR